MEISENDITKTHQWSHGLCGCFNNINICLLSWLAPCVVFGQTQEKLLGKSCMLSGGLFCIPILGCILEADQREILRKLRGIPGYVVVDFFTVLLCTCCTLAQEAQEVEQLHAEEFARQAGAEFGIGPDVPTVFGSTMSSQNGAVDPSHVVVSQPGGHTNVDMQPFERQQQQQGMDFTPPSYSADEVEMTQK